jgi:hypothetical protein
VFESKGGGEKQVMKVFDMPASGGVAMAMYVTLLRPVVLCFVSRA